MDSQQYTGDKAAVERGGLSRYIFWITRVIINYYQKERTIKGEKSANLLVRLKDELKKNDHFDES